MNQIVINKSSSSRKHEETRSAEKTVDYARILNEQPLQVVNLDLYKAAFEDDKYNEHQNKSESKEFKKFINPFIDDDYEEITQTIENGVVVKEVKKTLRQKPRIYSGAQISHMGDTGAHYEIKDINENFETKDIDEEEKEIGFKVQAHYLKTRNKNLFQESGNSQEISGCNNTQTMTIPKGTNEAINHPTGFNEPVSLLEESQEIILFQSDSKNNSPKFNKSQNIEFIGDIEKVDFNSYMNKGMIKEETKISPSKLENYTPISHLVERESPGPRRDMLTNSLEKKEINDNSSLQEDGANDDGSSESSSDLLPSTYDIKKMMPYDQRKDPNVKDQHPTDMKRKLNINYEELEDSGSDGSGDLGREDPNHLASIIEEEEEATEYQRSRSRSKSNSSSPITSNNKIVLDNKSKQAKVLDIEKKIPNVIKEESHIKKELPNIK